MATNNGNRLVIGPTLAIGTRVLVRRNAEADVTGEVVEDYAALTEPGAAGTNGRRHTDGQSPSTMVD